MKQVMIMAGLVFLALPFQANADDFGARFSDNAPSAFGEGTTFFPDDFDPSKIEPAAGDPSVGSFSAETAAQETAGRTPEELISEIEELMSEIETNIEENEAR